MWVNKPLTMNMLSCVIINGITYMTYEGGTLISKDGKKLQMITVCWDCADDMHIMLERLKRCGDGT